MPIVRPFTRKLNWETPEVVGKIPSAGLFRLNRLLASAVRLGVLTAGLLLIGSSPVALHALTAVPATLTSPTPGSTFNSSVVTFTWTKGTGVTAYYLSLGTAGPTSANFYESGSTTATSATVKGIPIKGVTMYVTVSSMINGAWKSEVYSFKESAVPIPSTMISPAAGSTLPGTTAAFSWTPGAGVTAYYLSLGTNGPSSANLYESGSIATTSVTAKNIPTTGVTVNATISSMINGAWKSESYIYKAPGTLTPVPATMVAPAPGSTLPGSSATFSWTKGTSVTAYYLSLGTNGPTSANLYESGSTTNTSVTATNLPTGSSSWGTMDAWLQCGSPATSTTVTTGVLSSCTIGNAVGGYSVKEHPLTPMAVAGSRGPLGAAVTVAGKSYTGTTATQSLSYNHDYDLQYFNFNLPSSAASKVLNMNGYITFAPPNTGANRDYYYDYLDAQDPQGFDAFVIQLHSGLYQGCTYCVFLETNPGWVTTHSSAGIPLTPGTRYAFSIQANESTGVASLAIYNATTFAQVGKIITSPSATGSNISNILVGNVEVGTASGYTSYFEDLMLDWSQHQSFPNVPHASTIYATVSSMIGGAWKSMSYTYSPAGAAPIVPTAPTVSGVSCTSASLTGTATDSCTVTMTGAVTAATTVTLSSNNASVIVPASVTVAAKATTATFTASAAAVTAAQSATLTASLSGTAKTYAIGLVADVPVLTVSTGSITFGSVVLNTPLTQALKLSSTGALPVTVSAVTVAGTGFSLGSLSLPVTLSPGQSLTVNILFAPLLAALDSGTLTITSNSSAGSTVNVSLSGTGAASAYQVELAWNAPSNPGVTITGYNIYRAAAGSSTYTQINTSIDGSTSYVDGTVQGGTTYDYYIESVDSVGASSAPSTVLGVSVP